MGFQPYEQEQQINKKDNEITTNVRQQVPFRGFRGWGITQHSVIAFQPYEYLGEWVRVSNK